MASEADPDKILLELRARILKDINFLLQCPYFPSGKPEHGAAKITSPIEAQNCDFGLPWTLEYM